MKINGVKVIKRYGVSTIFTGIIALLLGLSCISLLFIASISYSSPNGEFLAFSKNAIDYFSTFFGKTNADFTQYLYSIKPNGDLVAMIFTTSGPILAAMFVIDAFHSLFLIIDGIKLLCYGKVKHYKYAYRISWAVFIFTALYCVPHIVFGFLFSNYCGDALIINTNIINYILTGAALVLLIVLGIIYKVSFKKGAMLEDYLKSNQTSTTSTSNQTDSSQITIGYVNDHEYSKNTKLTKVTILEGATKIGVGGFANCINLKIVTIPKSVTKIESNAFFNCLSLERIFYSGTSLEWSKILRGKNWLLKAKTNNVYCSDKIIIVNPLK